MLILLECSIIELGFVDFRWSVRASFISMEFLCLFPCIQLTSRKDVISKSCIMRNSEKLRRVCSLMKTRRNGTLNDRVFFAPVPKTAYSAVKERDCFYSFVQYFPDRTTNNMCIAGQKLNILRNIKNVLCEIIMSSG